MSVFYGGPVAAGQSLRWNLEYVSEDHVPVEVRVAGWACQHFNMTDDEKALFLTAAGLKEVPHPGGMRVVKEADGD